MDKPVLQILEDIERPLIFASKNDFLNLDKLSGLHEYMRNMGIKAKSLGIDIAVSKVLEDLEKNVTDFDKLSSDRQKDVINKSIKSINEIKKQFETVIRIENTGESYNHANNLSSPVQYVKGVGPKISALLAKKGVNTIEDLIYYFPRKYEDRREITEISKIKPGNHNTIIGKILVAGILNAKTRKIFQVVISDNSGIVNLIWFQFNQRYLKRVYKKGLYVVVSGIFTVDRYKGQFQLIHPKPEDIEIFDNKDDIDEDNINFNRIVPVYPLTEGLKQRRIRKIMKYAIDNCLDTFDHGFLKQLYEDVKLMDLKDALSRVHFPAEGDNLVDLEDGKSIKTSLPHRTVVFLELFMLQLGLALKKRTTSEKQGISFKNDNKYASRLIKNLGYTLTSAQNRVIREIFGDLDSVKPMNRLLQGDVGSGKTIVSVFAMLKVCESGYQAVLMVPTEILAEQHLTNIKEILGDSNFTVVLLKSSMPKSAKQEVLDSIKSGSADIIVGTHAAFQQGVDYFRLGFVVIDEQHRFGVMQRSSLIKKGVNPDVLVMTATPIPRTLSMAYFSDLDLSVIDEMPKSRKKVKTELFYNDKKSRLRAYDIVRAEINKGRQAYVIAPLIEESEASDFKHLKYVNELAAELKDEILPEFRISILHGQMKSEEKEEIMKSYLHGEVNLLVSTSVIEVGIDIPNASVVVIENAERFGLSQLHQLRGRVGRGNYDSMCLLITSYKKSDTANKRLSILEKTNDGFKIAETDLLIRGPGEFIGTRQSGLPELKFAHIIRDSELLMIAKRQASRIVEQCNSPQEMNKYIDMLKNKWGEKLEYASIS